MEKSRSADQVNKSSVVQSYRPEEGTTSQRGRIASNLDQRVNGSYDKVSGEIQMAEIETTSIEERTIDVIHGYESKFQSIFREISSATDEEFYKKVAEVHLCCGELDASFKEIKSELEAGLLTNVSKIDSKRVDEVCQQYSKSKIGMLNTVIQDRTDKGSEDQSKAVGRSEES